LFLAVLCDGGEALARNPRDAFNRFAGISQSTVTKTIQADLRAALDAKTTCVDQGFRSMGLSTSVKDQSFPSSDGRVVPERASCQNQMLPSVLLTKLTSVQADPYGIDGLTLGSKVAYGTPAYRQYQCGLSQKFKGFVWCTKTIGNKEVRGRIKASILHAQDGTIVYINRYQEPAHWSGDEVADDIQRYSGRIGEEPHIIQLPTRPGLPMGILVAWGKVVLEPIVGDELRLLGEDKPLQTGIAIDFIGNFTQSARQGLPIYRLAGGAGFVWAASYNQSGRGTLRFSAVDASTYSLQSPPPSAITPPPHAADMGRAATAVVDAQSPGTTAPPPVDSRQTLVGSKHFDALTPALPLTTSPAPRRGEPCSALSECSDPTPAVSRVVSPRWNPNELVAQVLNRSTPPLQQTDPADNTAQNERKSAASNFGSTESEHVMLDWVVTYWAWVIFALIASAIAGNWSNRPRESRARGMLGLLGWATLAFIILQWPLGENLVYPGATLFLAFVCITGFLTGAWLRGPRTRTRDVAVRADEEVGREAEAELPEDAAAAKAAEKVRYAAETKALEDARLVAEAKTAAEEARPVVKAKAARDGRRTAEVKAAEDASRAAEVKAAGDTRLAAGKATEDVWRAADAAEDAIRPAEVKAAGDTCLAAGKVTEDVRRAAEVHAAEDAIRAAEVKAVEDGSRVAAAEGACPAQKVTDDVRSAAEVQAAEDANRAAEVKAIEDARRAARAKPTKERRRAAALKAAENGRLAGEAKATVKVRGAAGAKAAKGCAALQKKTKATKETHREAQTKPRKRVSPQPFQA
jgi:hypothetical protein